MSSKGLTLCMVQRSHASREGEGMESRLAPRTTGRDVW